MAEVAILVPVMLRPQNVQPFVRSLVSSIDRSRVRGVAIHDEGDHATIHQWQVAGATLLNVSRYRNLDRPGRFSEKVNAGYECSDEPWIFAVGDDVKFHPGWFDIAESVADNDHHVVGVNDLGDRRVTMGFHAPHFLIWRDYIDQVGASWDGPRVVAHEGYHHWYVDDEIAVASKQRGVWKMALDSVVEHMHPFYGKGPMDSIYELGVVYSRRDRILFEERLGRFTT